MATNDPPLDEIQWRHPAAAQAMGGIHTNSVLFYFAESPFYDKTSNNNVLYTQSLFNPSMAHIIHTREVFESRLKQMSGLEFIVAEEPAETAPGTGTGVWVINKQKRYKREPEDEIEVLGTYYVIGENIYMAPSLIDVLSFRMVTITESLNKCFAAAEKAQTWSPARGHGYKAAPAPSAKARALESRGTTPMPETQGSKATTTSDSKSSNQEILDARLAERSFLVHMQHGGDFMDENPITGKPGEFHLTSTGRKEKLQVPGLTNLNTSFKASAITQPEKKDAKAGEKTPKTPTGAAKIKRKKSKAGATPTSA
ncbi:hypothetical protein M426DRAFT_19652 [Hypoxylon sp. CI-4A]|nr:hypothetical protein M426DRAFT_19652 [Hypoxylon sp. CI-4A]